MRLSQLNSHAVGVSAVAVVILGLGIALNSGYRRPIAQLSETGDAQVTQRWVSPADPTAPAAPPSMLLNQIPLNAYGSAQPGEPAQVNATNYDENASATAADRMNNAKAAGPEGKDWSAKEWEIASKAVSAYRAAAKAANSVTGSGSSNVEWHEPEEIIKHNETH